MRIIKSIRISLLLISVMSFMTSCISTSSTLYSWHGYEDVTYRYSKKSTEELKVKLLEEYARVIDSQYGLRGVVPPGMYAEYGYMLYRTGKREEGIKFLKQEIVLYPESEKYISRIIKQLEK